MRDGAFVAVSERPAVAWIVAANLPFALGVVIRDGLIRAMIRGCRSVSAYGTLLSGRAGFYRKLQLLAGLRNPSPT